MEAVHGSRVPPRIERRLAHLKIISRLLGHELHVQQSSRVTLSREELKEILQSLEMFIEDVQGSSRQNQSVATVPAGPTPSRVN